MSFVILYWELVFYCRSTIFTKWSKLLIIYLRNFHQIWYGASILSRTLTHIYDITVGILVSLLLWRNSRMYLYFIYFSKKSGDNFSPATFLFKYTWYITVTEHVKCVVHSCLWYHKRHSCKSTALNEALDSWMCFILYLL